MIKLELYIREISRFLRTVTLKNRYFADQMLENWVDSDYRDSLALADHPYYRHLAGEYIVNAETFDNLRVAVGLPSQDRVNELRQLLQSKSGNSYQLAVEEFTELCQRIDYHGSFNREAVEASIDRYMLNEYGISRTVKVGKLTLPTDRVYLRFDQVPVIKSFDTKETTLFTKTILSSRAHRKTRSVYKIPSNYYDQLIQQYPDERDIIKAIMYPIGDLTSAYQAENYAILGYDLSLLEENERTSLYFTMEETLAMIRKRWDVDAFTYEELYALSMQAKIWAILEIALLKQRVKNIRTSEAHSFHVWNYLESHGLGEYRDVLTNKQALFLYKNYSWLYRNLGADRNLLILAHKLLAEHHVAIYDKTMLQTTETLREDPTSSTPVIMSGELQSKVMNRLATIENRDSTYTNKTLKAIEELQALNYDQTDTELLRLANPETLASIYEKERDLGIEYQTDTEFAKSTTDQTKAMSYTAHNQLPTKLLELNQSTLGDHWNDLYVRFITESIIYNVATGYGEDVLTLEYGDFSQTLTVKDLLLLFLYCEAKRTNTYHTGQKITKAAYLSVPYKHEFEPIPKQYHWFNEPRPTHAQLQIIPDVLQLKSDSDALSEFVTKYELVNPTDPRDKWRWVAKNGAAIVLTKTDLGRYVWVLSHPSGSTYMEIGVAYSNWLCHHNNWSMTLPDGSEVRAASELQVVDYRYVLDEWMPNYDTTCYYDPNYPDTSLVNLIEAQANGYLQINRELVTSARSRQHAAMWEIVDARTFCGWVKLNLSNYDTYESHFNHTPEVKAIVSNVELMDPKLQQTEYGYLADRIIMLLYPAINRGALGGLNTLSYTVMKLKQLITQLCSYNVVFIDGMNYLDNQTSSMMATVTLDYAQCAYGVAHNFSLGQSKSGLSLGLEFDDEWCYDQILDHKYVFQEGAKPKLYHETAPHQCADHQYVINSQVVSVYNTPVVPIEVFDSEIAYNWEWVVVLDLIDRDHIRDWSTPTKSQIVDEVLAALRWRFPNQEINTSSWLTKFNVRYYHLPFKDSVFTSLLDYDSTWDYHPLDIGDDVDVERDDEGKLVTHALLPRKLNQ